MKRVIKFWNMYRQDEGQFSDVSTKYEILPILVPDNAGPKELKAIAKQLGIRLKGAPKKSKPGQGYQRGSTQMTHFAKTTQKYVRPYFDKKEKYDWYIGFVTLATTGILEPSAKINRKMTQDQFNDIINERAYGVSDVGDFSMVPKETDMRVVMEDHSYYHEMAMLGYSQKYFEKLAGVKDHDDGRDFEDSVFRCDDCGTWDHNDSGYTYNYRIYDGEILGINCGCVMERGKKNFLQFVNKNTALELEAAEDLESDGLIEHVERFIGGMTDGRGGYFRGESTREGSPEGVLKEFLGKEPRSKFVFTHDESGQFQSYFSIWRVTTKGLATAKRAKKAA